MGFPKGCGNARRINSKSSAKWFTYQSVALRCHLNEKARRRNQALALIEVRVFLIGVEPEGWVQKHTTGE